MQLARLQVRPAALRCAVMCRAKKMPMADIRSMSAEQIDAKVTELKEELFRMRMKQATRQSVVSSDMQMKKKDIARLLTVKRQQEIADGVSLRESRRREKKIAVAKGMAL
jgi:large subunit ribosomal protein L29